MKKRKCILCGSKKFTVQKTKKSGKIYRCQRCDLGILDAVAHLPQKVKYSKKLREMHTILQNSIREGKIIEVCPQNSKKDSFQITYKYGKNVKVKKTNQKYSDFVDKTRERFDLIIFKDSLAWYRRPNLILKKTRSILLDRGLILIVVPNHDSYPINFLSEASSLYSFSQKSIKYLLKDSGYKLNYKTTFDSFSDIKKHFIGSPLEYIFYAPPYFFLRRIVWTLGWGGYIGVVAEKSSGYN